MERRGIILCHHTAAVTEECMARLRVVELVCPGPMSPACHRLESLLRLRLRHVDQHVIHRNGHGAGDQCQRIDALRVPLCRLQRDKHALGMGDDCRRFHAEAGKQFVDPVGHLGDARQWGTFGQAVPRKVGGQHGIAAMREIAAL